MKEQRIGSSWRVSASLPSIQGNDKSLFYVQGDDDKGDLRASAQDALSLQT